MTSFASGTDANGFPQFSHCTVSPFSRLSVAGELVARRRVLRLLDDLDHCKLAVLNNLGSPARGAFTSTPVLRQQEPVVVVNKTIKPDYRKLFVEGLFPFALKAKGSS